MTSPLHVLARVACDNVVHHSPISSPSPGPDDCSVGSSSRSWRCSSVSISDVPNFHHLCFRDDDSPSPDSPPQPLRHSKAANHAGPSTPSPRRKTSKKHSPHAMAQITYKQKARVRRDECMGRAMRIKSLDNSPVNDHQLHVLRMVYDQITMYPPESWMVIIAIVIRRFVSSSVAIHHASLTPCHSEPLNRSKTGSQMSARRTKRAGVCGRKP